MIDSKWGAVCSQQISQGSQQYRWQFWNFLLAEEVILDLLLPHLIFIICGCTKSFSAGCSTQGADGVSSCDVTTLLLSTVPFLLGLLLDPKRVGACTVAFLHFAYNFILHLSMHLPTLAMVVSNIVCVLSDCIINIVIEHLKTQRAQQPTKNA